MEGRKLLHDPTEMLTRAVQPALWLLVFGQVFTRTRAIPTGNLSYIDFMSPGILSQSVLFIAIFYGISVIWERDLGILHKFLVSPTPRSALVLGKALSAGHRGLTQAVIVYILAVLLGVRMDWNPAVPPPGRPRRPSGRGILLDLLARDRLPGQDEGALHGHRPDPHDAALLREQRDLPHLDNAALASGRFPLQSADLPGGRAPRSHDLGGIERIRDAGLDILVLTLAMAALVAVAAKLYPTLAV